MADDEKLVLPGTADAAYKFLKCPIIGKLRCSLLCETTCADGGWSDDKAKEVRSECESWKQYKKIRKEKRDAENS